MILIDSSSNVSSFRPSGAGVGAMGSFLFDATGGVWRWRSLLGDNSSTKMILSNGQLGIGTASPSAKLDVAGTSNLSGGVRLNGSVDTFGTFVLSFASASTFNSGSTVYGIKGEVYNTGLGSVYGMQLVAGCYASGTASELVGASFAFRTLSGTSNVTSGYGARIITPTIASGSTISTVYGVYIEAQKPVAGVTTGYGIYQAGGDLNYFAGNVGINTTSALYRLHVAGHSLISNGGNLFIGGNGNDVINFTPQPSGSGAILWVTDTVAGSTYRPLKLDASTFDLRVGGSSTTGLHITSGGNVGIGVAAPGYNLEVGGTGKFSGQFTLSNGMLLNNATSNLVNFGIGGAAGPAFSTRSNGTKLVLWDSLSGTEVDYGLGIDTSTLWFSINVVSNSFKWYGGTTLLMRLSRGNLVVGSGTGQLVNGATDGFLYIASISGTPGTPTAYTGSVPLVYDTSTHQLCVYDGGVWRKTAALT